MNPGEMARVLTKAAAFDQRTIGEADVMAWYDAVGQLDYDDAMTAVSRHYATNTDRIMPAHLRAEVLAIRNERAAQQQHEIRALPSKFEYDPERNERIREGIRKLAEGWGVPTDDDGSDPHVAALARARRERKSKMPEPRRRRDPSAKPIDLDKVTDGPEWAKAEIRERLAVAELHRNNRPCGRTACPRCNRVEAQ